VGPIVEVRSQVIGGAVGVVSDFVDPEGFWGAEFFPSFGVALDGVDEFDEVALPDFVSFDVQFSCKLLDWMFVLVEEPVWEGRFAQCKMHEFVFIGVPDTEFEAVHEVLVYAQKFLSGFLVFGKDGSRINPREALIEIGGCLPFGVVSIGGKPEDLGIIEGVFEC
jgi:hypothetical protein